MTTSSELLDGSFDQTEFSNDRSIAVIVEQATMYANDVIGYFNTTGYNAKLVLLPKLDSFLKKHPQTQMFLVLAPLTIERALTLVKYFDLLAKHIQIAIINVDDVVPDPNLLLVFNFAVFDYTKRSLPHALLSTKVQRAWRRLDARVRNQEAITHRQQKISSQIKKQRTELLQNLTIALHHELRNALTTVYAGSQILHQNFADGEPRVVATINSMSYSADVLKNTLDNLGTILQDHLAPANIHDAIQTGNDVLSKLIHHDN